MNPNSQKPLQSPPSRYQFSQFPNCQPDLMYIACDQWLTLHQSRATEPLQKMVWLIEILVLCEQYNTVESFQL